MQSQPEKKVSFDDLRSRLPASDLEIRSALNKNRILDLDDSLRSIPPSFLLTILPSLLSSLPLPAILAHPPNLSKKKSKPSTKPTEPVVLVSEAEESELLEALDSVDCGKLVGLTILGWFGEQDHEGGRWKFELEGIVRELGIDLLAAGGVSIPFSLPSHYSTRRTDRGRVERVHSLVNNHSNLS